MDQKIMPKFPLNFPPNFGAASADRLSSEVLLSVPIFVPIAIVAGFNEGAFAIYGILIIEAGLLTPPMGLLVFTVKSAVPDSTVTLGDIFSGSIPYWIMMLGVAALLLFMPGLATWLPGLIL